jgi:hypothetical protein
MIIFFLSFFLAISQTFAFSYPKDWNSAFRILDRHEFYQSLDIIDRPVHTWQHLFSVVYPDRNLKLLKDCVFYFIPKNNDGVLKLKSISLKDSCEKYVYEKGDFEVINLKSLQFSLHDKIYLYFTLADFSSQKWQIQLLKENKNQPQMLSSSAEYQMGKYLLLSSKISLNNGTPKRPKICHDINQDCNEVSPSRCELCPDGWYEVPNGCPIGPKYCGVQICGIKNRPACRKGTISEKPIDCRKDSSFAYCASGLTVQCEGPLAYCR